jgi:hypothetical protein
MSHSWNVAQVSVCTQVVTSWGVWSCGGAISVIETNDMKLYLR